MPPVLTETSLSGYGSYSIWNAVLGLAVFAAVAAILYVAYRRLAKKTFGGASKHMRIVERMAVSQGTYLLLVQVSQRLLVLSSTKDGLKFLCEIPQDTPQDTPQNAPPSRSDPVLEEPEPRVHVSAETGAFAAAFEKARIPESTDEDTVKIPGRKETNPSPGPQAATDSGRSAFTDYNSAIESMKMLGRMERPRPVYTEEYVAPVAPKAAAASYKAAAKPPQPEIVRETEAYQPPVPPPHPAEPQEVDEETADILQALKEHRRQRAVVSAIEEVFTKPPATRKAERDLAAQRLRADEDKVDELFDKISRRSSRYGSSKKE